MWDETNFYNVNTMILVKSPFRTQARSSRATKSYPCRARYMLGDRGLIDNCFSMLGRRPPPDFLPFPQTRRGIDDSSAKP